MSQNKLATDNACTVCGKMEDTSSVCGRCKKVSYCGSACQKSDWKSHKATCELFLEDVACCDACKAGQKVTLVCFLCGAIYCAACVDHVWKADSCQVCSEPQEKAFPASHNSIQVFLDLVEKDTTNKRRGFWLSLLGQYYRDGIDGGILAQDKEKAKRCFEIAGSLKYGEAYNKLAIMYSIEGDWQRSKETFEKGAALHDLASIFNLGQHYFSGDFSGGKPNYKMAKKWYHMGAELGDAVCCHQLSDMYRRGVGIPVNGKKAYAWCRRGAERGEATSQNTLGMRYLYGQDVSQSFEQARYWLGKAAAQGDELAIRNLQCYFSFASY